nr:hypothetical protein [Variovorax boronicumulans]
MLAVAIGGAAIPFYTWLSDRPSKAIAISAWSTIPLIQPFRELGDLEISIGGQEVKSLDLTTLEIKNSGNQPILKSDFATPIDLKVGRGTRVFRLASVESVPPAIKPEVTQTADQVKLEPLLLNPGDIVRLSVLTVGSRPSFETTTRVVGVKDVAVRRDEPNKMHIASVDWKHVSSLLLLMGLYGCVASFTGKVRRNDFRVFAVFIAAVVGFAATTLLHDIIVSGYSGKMATASASLLAGFAGGFCAQFVYRRQQRSTNSGPADVLRG